MSSFFTAPGGQKRKRQTSAADGPKKRIARIATGSNSNAVSSTKPRSGGGNKRQRV